MRVKKAEDHFSFKVNLLKTVKFTSEEKLKIFENYHAFIPTDQHFKLLT